MIFRSILLQQQWAEILLLLSLRKQRRWWDGSKCKCCEYTADEKMQLSRRQDRAWWWRGCKVHSQIPVQMWGLIKNQYLRSDTTTVSSYCEEGKRSRWERGGGGSKVWESFNGKRSLRRETWWKTRSTSILHNRTNSKHLPHICPFWYTTTFLSL